MQRCGSRPGRAMRRFIGRVRPRGSCSAGTSLRRFLEDLDAAEIQPTTLAEAELLCGSLYQAAAPEEALRRNVELSSHDSANRSGWRRS